MSQGVFMLVNKPQVPIDSLHLNMGSPVAHTNVKKLTISKIPPKIILNDKDLKSQIYRLPQTLQPDDTVKMEVVVRAENRSFENSV